MSRLTIVVKNGRVEELIADSDITIDVYDLDCINAGDEPEFNVYMTANTPALFKAGIKDLEERIDNMLKSNEDFDKRLSDIDVLKSIIEHNGDCEADNIFCACCPLANEDWECQSPYITAEDRDQKETVWKQERLEAAKKLLQELEHGTTIQQ